MAWIPAIASIAGTLLMNEQNEDIQSQNSAFNAEQAHLNREFQREQSNTVWSRAVADMKTAGLNPMLAYSQGGNPASSGSAATAGNPGNMQNVFANAGQSAAQWAQIENIEAQTEKTRAETENVRAELPGKQQSGPLTTATIELIRRQTTKQIASAELDAAQTDKVEKEIENVLKLGEKIDAETALTKINTILQRNDIPRMEAESRYFRTPVGRESPHNKYGPQTPFRFLEGLGERIINRWSSK